jgi:hypothetical protein
MKPFNAILPAFERFRLSLASSQAGIGLSLLGLLAGSLAGGLVVLFRLLIEFVQGLHIPYGDVENYEALPVLFRFALPIGGAVIIGLWFHSLHPAARRVGVIHVMERLQYHEGHLPLKNLAIQSLAGAIALICGHSVGRQAPSAKHTFRCRFCQPLWSVVQTTKQQYSYFGCLRFGGGDRGVVQYTACWSHLRDGSRNDGIYDRWFHPGDSRLSCGDNNQSGSVQCWLIILCSAVNIWVNVGLFLHLVHGDLPRCIIGVFCRRDPLLRA